MGGIMAKYFRWRKVEGAVPSRGPFLVIRTAYEVEDFNTRLPLPFPKRYRRYELGLYWSDRFHFKLQLNTVKRIYDNKV